jgi:ferrous iron transport protein B
VAARLLRNTLFRGEVTPFVMELPPYRLPTVRGSLVHAWERTWMFLRKAGTIILAAAVILWALGTFPRPAPSEELAAREAAARRAYADRLDRIAPLNPVATSVIAEEERLAAVAELEAALAEVEAARAQRRLMHSVLGRVGRAIEPVMRPAGFDWRISTSFIGAIPAKEIFVSQMGVIFSVGELGESGESLEDRLSAAYTPLQGFCIMLFALLTMPCVATMIATWRESGSIFWALGQAAGLTVIAWAITVAVYQTGTALGL